MTALETSIKTIMIQNNTVMGIRMVIVMTQARIWTDMGARIDHYDNRGSTDYDRGYDSRIGCGQKSIW